MARPLRQCCAGNAKWTFPFTEKITSAVRAHRGWFVAAIVTLSVAMWVTVGALFWFVRDTVTDLPDRDGAARRRLDGAGDHAVRRQRPARVHDLQGAAHRRAAVARCRRIWCARSSPIEDQRFYDHGGVDVVRVAGAALNNLRERPRRAGRQHDHAAARASELPDARQDDPPQAEGNRRRGAARRASSRRTRSSSCI